MRPMETATPTPRVRVKRDKITVIILMGVGLAAGITSWVGWSGLVELCGFRSTWTPAPGWPELKLSYVIAVAVDLYALGGVRMWLSNSPHINHETRKFARASALSAVAAGAAANIAYHLLALEKIRAEYAASGQQMPNVWIVIAVSVVAPVMLGVVAHLDALYRADVARSQSGETVVQADKTETPARRIAGLLLARVESRLAVPTETETGPPARLKSETEAVPVAVSADPVLPVASVEIVETGSPRPATVSSLTDKSTLFETRLQMIKDAEPKWFSPEGDISKKRIGEIIGLSNASGTQQKLRDALVREIESLTPTVPDDARDLMEAL